MRNSKVGECMLLLPNNNMNEKEDILKQLSCELFWLQMKKQSCELAQNGSIAS
jgi:hypothetical protein